MNAVISQIPPSKLPGPRCLLSAACLNSHLEAWRLLSNQPEACYCCQVSSVLAVGGYGIRQFALLHKVKMIASNVSTCCEGQATRILGYACHLTYVPIPTWLLQDASRVPVQPGRQQPRHTGEHLLGELHRLEPARLVGCNVIPRPTGTCTCGRCDCACCRSTGSTLHYDSLASVVSGAADAHLGAAYKHYRVAKGTILAGCQLSQHYSGR